MTDAETNANARWLRPELAAPWWEIVMIAAVTIGYSATVSTWQSWHGSSLHYVGDLVTNARMVRTIAVESGILASLFIWLWRRGWKLSDLRIRPTLVGTAQGIGLLFAMGLVNSIVVAVGMGVSFALQKEYMTFTAYLIANSPHLEQHSVTIGWWSLIPALVLNGYFEEITTMGYAFCQFAQKRGPLFALALTVALRASCHTYQGIVHALGIAAAFTVSGLVYWRTRNLWPLIFAHIIVDTASMSVVKLLFGR